MKVVEYTDYLQITSINLLLLLGCFLLDDRALKVAYNTVTLKASSLKTGYL